MDGLMDRWMDGWVGGWTSTYTYTTISVNQNTHNISQHLHIPSLLEDDEERLIMQSVD